jgi:hypothetical protein
MKISTVSGLSSPFWDIVQQRAEKDSLHNKDGYYQISMKKNLRNLKQILVAVCQNLSTFLADL